MSKPYGFLTVLLLTSQGSPNLVLKTPEEAGTELQTFHMLGRFQSGRRFSVGCCRMGGWVLKVQPSSKLQSEHFRQDVPTVREWYDC